ncbi:MAG: SDR family NAD(P)-dependent oxidoreductase [Flavobacteriaceae bacterium]|nr:SDR family NAD(P)-dependent oxidoreductase [Bacteroidia bacterium]NNK82497.1 SDR family NAD(P)-dependent oxidoreductase [Flavobacteriaceae bacterium]
MKNSIVFGASSGIGKQLARFLVEDGYKVVVTGRRKELLEELKSENPEAYIIKAFDVQDLKETSFVFNTIVTNLKTIDLIIHASGIGLVNEDLDWKKEFDTLKTNVLGATRIYNLAFNLFKKQGFGHLVSITSIASLRGNRFAPSYFASKAYQVNYLESLYFKSKEIKGGKVYVTDIRPGFVDTRMALGDGIFWMASLEKASKQIYRAIRLKKRRVYITKRWNIIACVLKIAPSWLIKKLT